MIMLVTWEQIPRLTNALSVALKVNLRQLHVALSVRNVEIMIRQRVMLLSGLVVT